MINIANFLTLFNLTCGCCAVISLLERDYSNMLLFFGLALLFDLLDGLAARLTGGGTKLGAQLDSLADMVSFGFFPGMVLFQLIIHVNLLTLDESVPPIIGFLFTICAALRLAKFNSDDRQSIDFMGLNTPAATIAVVGVFLLTVDGYCSAFIPKPNQLVIATIILVLCALMLSDLPMISFKPDLKNKRRTIKQVILIIGGLIILYIMKTCALPFLILYYILLAVLSRLFKY